MCHLNVISSCTLNMPIMSIGNGIRHSQNGVVEDLLPLRMCHWVSRHSPSNTFWGNMKSRSTNDAVSHSRRFECLATLPREPQVLQLLYCSQMEGLKPIRRYVSASRVTIQKRGNLLGQSGQLF